MLPDRISVVTATALRPERRAGLVRAIESAASDAEAVHEIIVVANGSHVTADGVARIASMPMVRVIRAETGSYPLARRMGFDAVRSQYACNIDDDDEFLPGALRARLDFMRAHPDVDALVTNGLLGDSTEALMDDELLQNADRDPLGAMLRGNWLANCGGTFRMATVPTEFFDPEFRHYEWTLTAVRLALACRLAFATDRHFRYQDTPGSLSKTTEYLLAEPEVWQRAERLTRGTPDHRRVQRRLGSAYHCAADRLWRLGNRRAAWSAHLRSLQLPGGMRFAAFTRHWLTPWTQTRRPSIG